VIARVRRGETLDSVTLFHAYGRALHLVSYGYTEDEARRNREELIRWLTDSGIPLVDDEVRAP
jgi:hypothetical protein